MEDEPTIEVNTFFNQEQWNNFCDYEKRNYEKQYQNFLTLKATGLCDVPPPFVWRKLTTNKSTKYGRSRKRKSKEFEDDQNVGPSTETQTRKKSSKLNATSHCAAADGEQNKCHFKKIIKSSTTQETMLTSSSLKHSCSQLEMLKFWHKVAFLHPSTKKSKSETKLMNIMRKREDLSNFQDYCSKIASGEPVSHSTYIDLLKRAFVVIDKTTDHHILNDIGNETVSVDEPERLKIENITSKLNDCINRVLDKKFSMREIERINMQQPDLNDFELSLVALLFDDKNELSNDSNETIGDNGNGGLPIELINDPKKREDCGVHINKDNEAKEKNIHKNDDEKTVVKYPKRENFSWDSNKDAVDIIDDNVFHDEASTRLKTFISSNFGEKNDPIVSKPIINMPSISKDNIKNSITVFINKVTDTTCDKRDNLMNDKENSAFMKRTGKFRCFHSKFKCSFCNYETTSSSNLKTHEKKHTGDMLKCSYCNYETNISSNLKTHERKHTGDNLKCTNCNYETTHSSNLKAHQRSHTGDMLKCSYCNYKTTHSSNLKAHQRNHNGDMLQCTNCNYETIWSSSLKRHERNKH